jgi:8-oxo-dGTP pyrophosphatase MutT (NUDIX family)
MIYEEMPEDFESVFEVVACFVEHDGKILMLHRQDHKPQGDTWGGPAGKVDEGESIHEALKREVFEETSIELKDPKHFKKLFVRFPDYDFVYHIFHELLEELVEVNLREEEHKDFDWVSPKDALGMNLMLDEDDCIKMFYNIE